MQHIEIRVEGQIDETWSEWFEGFCVTHTQENETILTGEIADQTALYGMITRLRDLGLKLISIVPIEG